MPEFQNKLNKKFPEHQTEIQKITEEFAASSWISNERYIPEFIRVKSQYNQWGPKKISQKLKEKGLNKSEISPHIEEFFSTNDISEQIKVLAEEKFKTLHKKKAADKTAAIQRFLYARGFNFRDIIEATKDLL